MLHDLDEGAGRDPDYMERVSAARPVVVLVSPNTYSDHFIRSAFRYTGDVLSSAIHATTCCTPDR